MLLTRVIFLVWVPQMDNLLRVLTSPVFQTPAPSRIPRESFAETDSPIFTALTKASTATKPKTLLVCRTLLPFACLLFGAKNFESAVWNRSIGNNLIAISPISRSSLWTRRVCTR